MSGNIPRNIWQRSPEYWLRFPEYNVHFISRVPHIPCPVPVFLVLYIGKFGNVFCFIHDLTNIKM